MDATPVEHMIAKLRQPIMQLIERVRLIETKDDNINYDTLGSLISAKLKAARRGRNHSNDWQPRSAAPSRVGRGGRRGRGAGIFAGDSQQQQQQQMETAIFGEPNFSTVLARMLNIRAHRCAARRILGREEATWKEKRKEK